METYSYFCTACMYDMPSNFDLRLICDASLVLKIGSLQVLGAQSFRAPAFKFQDKSQPCCRSQKACRHSFFGNGHPGSRRTSTIVAAADYYQTLGVDRGADKKAIKSAYRCYINASVPEPPQLHLCSICRIHCL